MEKMKAPFSFFGDSLEDPVVVAKQDELIWEVLSKPSERVEFPDNFTNLPEICESEGYEPMEDPVVSEQSGVKELEGESKFENAVETNADPDVVPPTARPQVPYLLNALAEEFVPGVPIRNPPPPPDAVTAPAIDIMPDLTRAPPPLPNPPVADYARRAHIPHMQQGGMPPPNYSFQSPPINVHDPRMASMTVPQQLPYAAPHTQMPPFPVTVPRFVNSSTGFFPSNGHAPQLPMSGYRPPMTVAPYPVFPPANYFPVPFTTVPSFTTAASAAIRRDNSGTYSSGTAYINNQPAPRILQREPSEPAPLLPAPAVTPVIQPVTAPANTTFPGRPQSPSQGRHTKSRRSSQGTIVPKRHSQGLINLDSFSFGFTGSDGESEEVSKILTKRKTSVQMPLYGSRGRNTGKPTEFFSTKKNGSRRNVTKADVKVSQQEKAEVKVSQQENRTVAAASPDKTLSTPLAPPTAVLPISSSPPPPVTPVAVSQTESAPSEKSAAADAKPEPSAGTPKTMSFPTPTRSWASVLGNSTPSPATKSSEQPADVQKAEPLPQVNGDVVSEYAILSNYQLNHTVVNIQVRRLVNQANWCYVNSILQSLLACPPFYQLLKSLPAYPPLGRQGPVTPVLDAMVEFVNQFETVEDKKKNNKKDLKHGASFEPVSVYNVLDKLKTSENTFQRGKQEDAEEFLTCLLNKLHEEIGALLRHGKSSPVSQMNGHGNEASSSEGEEDGEWLQVGHRNKAIPTASNVDKTSTPISKIFGGLLRSSLSTGGKNTDSAVLEPFFTVPLNVQTTSGNTIEDALKDFVSKEIIDGYTCPKTKTLLDAHRKLTFELLPPILIVHLKCFVYDIDGGSQKVLHSLRFSETLEFESELMSSQKRPLPLEQRKYKLFAVVYHSGAKTTGGHYHTDVFHNGTQSWVKFDDNSTKVIAPEDVLDFRHPCVPYLLYYKRSDMMQSSTSSKLRC